MGGIVWRDCKEGGFGLGASRCSGIPFRKISFSICRRVVCKTRVRFERRNTKEGCKKIGVGGGTSEKNGGGLNPFLDTFSEECHKGNACCYWSQGGRQGIYHSGGEIARPGDSPGPDINAGTSHGGTWRLLAAQKWHRGEEPRDLETKKRNVSMGGGTLRGSSAKVRMSRFFAQEEEGGEWNRKDGKRRGS